MLTLVIGGVAVAAGPDMVLSDAYLETFEVKFAEGGASLDSVQDLLGTSVGVGFAVSGLGKIGIADDFVAPVGLGSESPCAGGFKSDCSAFSKLKLRFKNLGTQGVHVNVNMNTGFTDAGTGTCGAAEDAKCDVFWQGPWTFVGPGNTKVVTLNFSKAEAFNCDGVAVDGCVNGLNKPILRLDEVTNIGFQVANFGPPDGTATWLIVRGNP